MMKTYDVNNGAGTTSNQLDLFEDYKTDIT